MEGYAIPSGMPWHLTDDVYVPINSNTEFHWDLTVVALKELCIKVYDSMSSIRSNRKLSSEIQKMATMLPKYLELSGFFEKNERTNWSVLKCYQGKNKSHPFEVSHVTGIAQQESSSLDCGIFVAAYAEYLSDGLQVPSCGISADTILLRYALLLWNYGIVKARNGYVSDNENSEMRKTIKKI
ncbi:uncharacterized protein [Solanum lycopersicum]|uniref:uncharacterized protein n=1 Tax=Solanum lycopersicum TaxID=4081 RepID=UPI0002BC8468|nr:uncharacterized protein LOC101267316 [Solanum lycopersicum]XP_010322196.1 uncharacterized protein LOC101267316 [Solanum lycopersicum]